MSTPQLNTSCGGFRIKFTEKGAHLFSKIIRFMGNVNCDFHLEVSSSGVVLTSLNNSLTAVATCDLTASSFRDDDRLIDCLKLPPFEDIIILKLPIKPVKAMTKHNILNGSTSLSIYSESKSFIVVELDKSYFKMRQKMPYSAVSASMASFDDSEASYLSLSVNNFDEILSVISIDRAREMAITSDANSIRFRSFWSVDALDDASRKMTSSFILDSASKDFISTYEYKNESSESIKCVFACKETKAFVAAIPKSNNQMIDIRYMNAGAPIKISTQAPNYTMELILSTLFDPQHAYIGDFFIDGGDMANSTGRPSDGFVSERDKVKAEEKSDQ